MWWSSERKKPQHLKPKAQDQSELAPGQAHWRGNEPAGTQRERRQTAAALEDPAGRQQIYRDQSDRRWARNWHSPGIDDSGHQEGDRQWRNHCRANGKLPAGRFPRRVAKRRDRFNLEIYRLERVKGIEPSYEAWEAAVLPLNYTRVVSH